MITGIGCDIIESSRIKESIAKHGDEFLNYIYTKQELANAPKSETKKISYYANRFAAKEAFAKAMGTGIGEQMGFKDIEILSKDSGQPFIVYPEHLGNLKVHLSISDESAYSIAMVVIEKE